MTQQQNEQTAVVPANGGQLAERKPGALTPQQGSVAAAAAGAMQEVRLAMEMALAYPRDEDAARARLVKACDRFAFAEKAMYAFPRGNTTVTGPSIKLAEEMAKSWRNVRWGHYILADDEGTRTVRGYCWDLEGNTKKEIDVQFNKLVYRKAENKGKGGYRPADERELLELTNLNGSKASRNAIISLLPWDLVQDLIEQARKTVKEGIKKDPEKFRKDTVAVFARQGVSPGELTAFLGFNIEHCKKEDDIAMLRAVYKRLADGEATWPEIVAERSVAAGVAVDPSTAPTSASAMRDLIAKKAAGVAADAPKKKGARPAEDGPQPTEGGQP